MRWIPSFFRLFGICVAFMFMPVAASSQDVIHVLVQENPPFSFWDKGELRGIDIELFNELSKKGSRPIAYHRFPFYNDLKALSVLNEKKFDVLLGGLVVNNLSAPHGFFSRPYIIEALCAMGLQPQETALDRMLRIFSNMGIFVTIMIVLFFLGMIMNYIQDRNLAEFKKFCGFSKFFVISAEWIGIILTGSIFHATDPKNPPTRIQCAFWSVFGAIFNLTCLGTVVSLISLGATSETISQALKIESLRNKPLGFIEGNTYQEVIRGMGGYPVPVHSIKEGLALLKDKKIAAIVEMRSFLEHSLSQEKFTEPVAYATLQHNELAFAARTPEMATWINTLLFPLRPHEIDKICRKYVKTDDVQCSL